MATNTVPASKKIVSDANATLILDRPHRFAIGDVVRHVDDELGDERRGCRITALTLLNSVANIFVPTYTLEPVANGYETMEDVLCTVDLVLVRKAR